MKIKYFTGIIVIVIILLSVYFFILPPRIINTSPPDKSSGVNLGSRLIIKFDKPVRRQILNHFIIPDAYGEWRFEDPIIRNHLFRTLVFIPAIDFKPGTEYKVKIDNIISPLGIGLSNNYSFSFKTKPLSSKKISQNKTQLEKTQNPNQKPLLLSNQN